MKNQTKINIPKAVIQMLFFIVLIPFLPLLLSCRWDWWQAWLYFLLSVLGFVISRFLAARRHPDLIVERARFMQHEDAEAWDRKMAFLLGLGGFLVILVAGLDARFYWSRAFSMQVTILALLILLAGYFLSSYAIIENRFFSGMVRLQVDRGHQVVASGPYRWLRHPGYAGGIMTYLATPFFLDSGWAVLPAIFMIVIMVIRTSLEDKFLQAKLAGYSQYTRQVRYRLVPGVW